MRATAGRSFDSPLPSFQSPTEAGDGMAESEQWLQVQWNQPTDGPYPPMDGWDPVVLLLRLVTWCVALFAAVYVGYRAGHTASSDHSYSRPATTSSVELAAVVDDLQVEVDRLRRTMDQRVAAARERNRALAQEISERETELAKLRVELEHQAEIAQSALKLRDEAVAALQKQGIQTEQLLKQQSMRVATVRDDAARQLAALEKRVNRLAQIVVDESEREARNRKTSQANRRSRHSRWEQAASRSRSAPSPFGWGVDRGRNPVPDPNDPFGPDDPFGS